MAHRREANVGVYSVKAPIDRFFSTLSLFINGLKDNVEFHELIGWSGSGGYSH